MLAIEQFDQSGAINPIQEADPPHRIECHQEVLEESADSQQSADAKILFESCRDLDRTTWNMERYRMHPSLFPSADPVCQSQPTRMQLDSKILGQTCIEETIGCAGIDDALRTHRPWHIARRLGKLNVQQNPEDGVRHPQLGTRGMEPELPRLKTHRVPRPRGQEQRDVRLSCFPAFVGDFSNRLAHGDDPRLVR